MPPHAIDPEVFARRIAGEALCHIDTARKFVRGEPVRGIMLKQQLERAKAAVLQAHGQSEQLQDTGT